MKKNNFIKMLMFISSYLPLYFFLVIVKLDHISSLITTKNKKVEINWLYLMLFISLIILIIISLFVSIIMVSGKGSSHSIMAHHVEPSRDTIISYIATYIIPMTSLANADVTSYMIIANIGLFMLIGLLYVRLNLVYLNPVLALLGYIPYFAGQQVIISDIPYRYFISDNKRKWNGTHISSYIVVIRKKDNQVHS
ncbi:hypothetical protein ACPBEI_09450 [Latilactobacillus sakei]